MNITIRDVLKLLEKFESSSATELNLRSEGTDLVLRKEDKLRRREAQQILPADETPEDLQSEEPPMMVNKPTKTPQSAATGSVQQDLIAVRSPIVGTFYRSPAPDAPAFVKEGSKVKQGDTVGIIEAMKIMNKLEAEFDMEIVNILVQNATMVEHGSVLFEVKKL